jgi:hypothetical protein
MKKCLNCNYEWNCSLQKMPEYDCCNICIYHLHDCLITGDLVHWCKAYAELDPHDRLKKVNTV